VISFVVPAYNEEQHIRRTLESIHESARATGEPYEIIVADDASSDGTHDIAAQSGARVISVQHRQIAATRNAGARAAFGDVLFFVDADTSVSPGAVREALRAMLAGAVGGGSRVHFDGRFPLHFRALIWASGALSRATRLAFGCFLFCRKDAFDAVAGFDETLFASEELALSRALKRRGRFVILRESVTTSGRKLRAHSAWEVWRALGSAALHMLGIVRGRRGLEAWYGGRRRDPEAHA
jgi:glycosyltransferase involved in cell wall biosynthesis